MVEKLEVPTDGSKVPNIHHLSEVNLVSHRGVRSSGLEKDGTRIKLSHMQSLDGISRNIQDAVLSCNLKFHSDKNQYFLKRIKLFRFKIYLPCAATSFTDCTLVPYLMNSWYWFMFEIWNNWMNWSIGLSYKLSLYWPASMNRCVWMSACICSIEVTKW